jgi:hypothetical protein
VTSRLVDMDAFHIPADVIASTDAALRETGAAQCERFVLWTGSIDGSTFTASTAYHPAQTAYRTADGLCVTVGGDELHRLNMWLYENRQTLAVQVHTHPNRAYHSDTDSTFPIVTELGGLSLVVPDFGERGITGGGVTAYRLGPRGWRRLRGRRYRRLVRFDMLTPGGDA